MAPGTTTTWRRPAAVGARRSRLGEVVLTSFADRRDRLKFAAAYADPDSGITTGPRPTTGPVCVAPLTYIGHEAIKADIGILRGNGFQTLQRVYWNNKATAITADVPSEAELTPALWGKWQFKTAQ